MSPASVFSLFLFVVLWLTSLLPSSSSFDVIRFIPALNITEKELDEACRIFKEALEEVAQSIGA